MQSTHAGKRAHTHIHTYTHTHTHTHTRMHTHTHKHTHTGQSTLIPAPLVQPPQPPTEAANDKVRFTKERGGSMH